MKIVLMAVQAAKGNRGLGVGKQRAHWEPGSGKDVVWGQGHAEANSSNNSTSFQIKAVS